MKTADSENPNHGVAWPRNRAHGAVGQNRSRLIKWAESRKFQPKEVCFFLTSPFIELTRQVELLLSCPLSGSVYNRFSQAYLRLLIGEIVGNSTKRPFRLPLDIATRLEKWI